MNTSTANLSITLQPSKTLLLSLSFLYLVAILSVLFIVIPVFLKIVASLIIVYLGVVTIKQFVLLTNDHSVVKLSCADKGKARIELKNGSVSQAKIISAQWLFGYFAILVFKDHSKKHKVTIAKDAMSQEQFYTLRLYLRSLNTLR